MNSFKIIKKSVFKGRILLLLLSVLHQLAIAQTSCDPAGTPISFVTTGNNTSAGYNTVYVLTDVAGTIIQSVTSPFNAPNTSGNYRVYTINYNATAPYIAPTLTAGTNINAVGGSCVDISNPLRFAVCEPCNAPGSTISFSTSGNTSTSGYITRYFVTNTSDVILQEVTSPFTVPATAGDYKLFTVNYDGSMTAPTLTVGTNINSVGGTCVAISQDPLFFSVCSLAISGNVYDDANGLTDATVNGTGIGSASSTQLYANLLDNSGNVVATTAVGAGGIYTFNTLNAGTYSIQISTNQGTVGSAAPTTVLPSNWVNTGENIGTSAGSDGTANGNLAITLTTSSITNANFGIEQLPVPTNNTASSQVNPGGTNNATVSATTFTATDADGTVANIRITTFPSNATSITINGTQYTSSTFPVGGVTIPTNGSGNPTQAILVDPIDGAVTVAIPYVAIDNAGKESSTTATASVPFSTLAISGNVYDDANGLTDATVNGTGIGSASSTQLYANLLDNSGNVVATTAVGAGGIYTFSTLNAGTYSIQISTNQGTVGSAAPSTVLPSNWVNTGENIGTSAGNDGTANGNLAITLTTSSITNANFGIEQLPVPTNNTASSQVNPGGTNNATVSATTFTATDADGTVASIRITTFPSNATSITINGTQYTSSTFPVGGVTIPTNGSGNPTQAILVDPIDGAVTVAIPYVAIDNAGKESSTTATASVPFNVPAAIGSYVWLDSNGNGLNDEPVGSGINGVSVELWSAGLDGVIGGGDDILIGTTTTSNDGNGNAGAYNFNVTQSGGYYVKFPTSNAGNILTYSTSTPATDDNSDANRITGNSPVFTIDMNGTGVAKENYTIDAGFVPPAQFGDYVWLDANQNGIQDPTEVGVAGVSVELYNATTNELIATTYTDAYGLYTFSGLLTGDYKLKFTLPVDYEFTTKDEFSATDATDSDVNTSGLNIGYTDVKTLLAGDSDMDWDAGIYFATPSNANIGNYVWYDSDKDGIQDATEKGVAGVVVTLYDASNQPIATTFTNADGFYCFRDLPAGVSYKVGFTLPIGYQFTAADNPATTDDFDSDVNTTVTSSNFGTTQSFTLINGENKYNCDAGIYQTSTSSASIGSIVWNDANHDGIQEVNETGVGGVVVTLKDTLGNVVMRTVTNTFGQYVFNNIPQGWYTVAFDNLPSGWAVSPKGAGTDSLTDSDANAGVTPTTDRIYLDASDRNMTIDMGIYNPAPAGTATIGDIVWYDRDQDGIQDVGETGVPGVTVYLKNNLGTIIATATTDADGKFQFNDLPAGTYSLQYANLPMGYTFSPDNATNDSADSDADANGNTATFTVSAGQNITNVDAGIYNLSTPAGLASIGNFVWYDLNNNGIQDAGEPGVNNVLVKLYDATGTTVIAYTRTDATGYYMFNNLPAGTYVVGFESSTFPSGYDFVAPDAGTSDNLDSDANITTGKSPAITVGTGESNLSVSAGLYSATAPTGSIGSYVWNDQNNDGIQDATEKGIRGVTVTLYNAAGQPIATTTTDANGFYLFPNLPAGDYRVGFSQFPTGFSLVSQDATSDNLDSDANPTTGLTPIITLTSGMQNNTTAAGITSSKASIGSKVWFDADKDGVQDPSEVGVAGITVTLYNANGEPVASTITDAKGEYYFPNVNPTNASNPSYSLGFSTLPNGTKATKQNASTGNDDTDSDVNPITNLITGITLAASELNYSLDMGIYEPIFASISGFTWYDYDVNNPTAPTNQDGLQDPNEPVLPGITVYLFDANNNLVASVVSDATGKYLFDNLEPGSYSVRMGTLPEGTTLTTYNNTSNSELNSDADPSTANPLSGDITYTAGNFTVSAGQKLEGADAGILPSARIEGKTFYDGDITPYSPDGLRDGTEPGVRLVEVTLYELIGGVPTPIRTTYTDPQGNYYFNNLTPGKQYQVGFQVANPNGCATCAITIPNVNGTGNDAFDSDADVTSGLTPIFVLGTGQKLSNIDAGYRMTAVFPIELLSFEAKWANNQKDGALRWLTTSEINTSHFNIERSLDGISFDYIGKKSAAGNSSQTLEYQYVDEGVGSYLNGKVYYRLKMIDLDGTSVYSNVVALNKQEGFNDIFVEVYPNPAKSELNINYQLYASRQCEMIIYNHLGQKLYSTNLKNGDYIQTEQVDISDWANGIYYLEIQSPRGSKTIKVIKE